jgi:hypothetical protein
MEDLSALSAKPRLRLLLDCFSQIKDTRQSWKLAYPLREVLFLVVCATIANRRSSIGAMRTWRFCGLFGVLPRYSVRRPVALGDEPA